MLDETRNQMSQMKLHGMLKSLDLRLEYAIGQGWGAGDFLSAMVQDLHDLLEERQVKSTIITTQLPLKNWNEIIEDPLALDTVVDKLKHGILHMTLEGESYRKKKGQRESIDK